MATILTNGSSALNVEIVTRPHAKKTCLTNHKVNVPTEVYPLKDIEDIEKIKNYYLSQDSYIGYRDYTSFVIGINTGLRCGDIVTLKWSTFFDNDGQIYNKIIFKEEKTKKFRPIYINESVKDALRLFWTKSESHEGYIFSSQRNPHIDTNTLYRYLKEAAKSVGITFNVGSHTIRKTWGYHQYKAHSPSNPRFIYELQKMFVHSSSEVTLAYIGITDERQEEYYNGVNL